MRMQYPPKKIVIAMALALASGSMLVACGGGDGDAAAATPADPNAQALYTSQPESLAQSVALRTQAGNLADFSMSGASAPAAKSLITVDGLQFKDLNANGTLDVYEDWRKSVDARVDDLISLMTLEEKVGMMMIDTLNAGCHGEVTPTAVDYIGTQKMNRFILRSVANATATTCTAGSTSTSRSGFTVTPEELAQFSNAIQAMAEGTRLGIPAIFKDNARNHVEADPRFGIGAGAGAFTQFPKEAGIAAAALGEQFLKEGKATTGDMSVIKTFTDVMGPEYNAVGLRGMYGYMADLLTEPRWYRGHEVFTEDADLNANIMPALVNGLQGGPINPATKVALTMKHFPGGGPQELGMDPHYSFGKNQVYPGDNFGYHLKPFTAAINAGVSAIMPYYGVPINVTYDGTKYDQVGFAFSKQIVTDLLRGKLGFNGYVNSDTGIINDRAWGLESKTVPERVAAAINGGTETLSGYHTNATIKNLVGTQVSEARVNEAVKRLLREQFRLGLFENPYVDASKASSIIGNTESVAKGLDIQKKSVVLLDNKAKVLPLQSGTKVYTMGMDKTTVEGYGYTVTDGNYTAGTTTRPSAAGNDVALIRVLVKDASATYGSKDSNTGANPLYLNPLTGKTWGSEDPCVMYPSVNSSCTEGPALGNALVFGGALPWDIGDITFTGMAAQTKSRTMYPTLADIKAIAEEVGGWDKVVLSIYFRSPYVLDDDSGLKNAGALMATFGVTDKAMMEVVSGKFTPQGKLPFALPKTHRAVYEQQSDVPGYDETSDGALYKFGYGMNSF